ncbi:hypothetical protein [Salibaculum halophilum]|uniref:hypothetical protein n=1 Tax=Salibaculum halophilum TaxID=1914408 RepID=UPI00117B9A12|nr:hypothetical protein [Salibaculum halophilum]
MSKRDVPVLDLPNRWEKLISRAEGTGIDPKEFVERVDDAAERVDELLNLVQASGGGIFEVFLGFSGSGKTTFVNTLPRFFDGIEVESFPSDQPLDTLKEFISKKYVSSRDRKRIILIERRDNPDSHDLDSVRDCFVKLLDFFRTSKGTVLVLWTVTDEPAAEKITETAWAVGRDSIVDPQSRGLYRFNGLSRNKYKSVADNTARNLTGDGLEVFGITDEIATDLLTDCETISDYYGKLVRKSRQVQGATWTILKERVHPKLWIVLPGDTRDTINSTVRALTQGTRSRIDVDLLREFITDPNNNAQYVKDWKQRLGTLAHIFRTLDVRLFSMPPNVSVAAIRCFANDDLKTRLEKRTASKTQSATALKKTRVYKEILAELSVKAQPFAEGGKISKSTEDEYRRIQRQAADTDKPLNKALGELIRFTLQEDSPSSEISIEKKDLANTGLQPDILVKLSPNDFICLEPTWRSSGHPIPPQKHKNQNTLAEAHIKQYVLNKALDYTKAMGL